MPSARHVEELLLGEAGPVHRVLDPLADHVELALERGSVGHARRAADEHLLEHGLDGPRARAHRGGIGRDISPAHDGLAFILDDLLHDTPALRRLAGRAGQEDEARAVVPGGREGDARARALAAEEGMRHLDEDARAVAGVDLAAARPPVQQVLEHLQGLAHDGVGSAPLDVHDEADAAGVVLVGGVVESLGRGQTRSGGACPHRRRLLLVSWRVHRALG
jgi:hypothetical protein